MEGLKIILNQRQKLRCPNNVLIQGRRRKLFTHQAIRNYFYAQQYIGFRIPRTEVLGAFTTTAKDGWINAKRLITDKNYRKANFKGIGSDVRLNCLAGGIIFFVGDIFAQYIEHQKHVPSVQPQANTDPNSSLTQQTEGMKIRQCAGLEYKNMYFTDIMNLKRSLAMSLQGILLNGVMLCPFYRWMDVLFGDSHKNKTLWPGIPIKILSVQLLYMPISTALYIFFTPILHYFLNTGIRPGYKATTSAMSESLSFVTVIKDGMSQVHQSFFHIYGTSWLFWPVSDAINMRLVPVRYRPVWDSFIDIFWTAFLSLVCHDIRAETRK